MVALLWLGRSNNQDGSGWGIYGQRFDADGFTVGDEFMVNTSTQNSQEYPRVAALSDGGFVITWQGNEENSRLQSVWSVV